MKNNTINDKTQRVILPSLEITEQLMKKAIRKEMGGNGYAEITAMPDLGFANNSIRMRGGFFTGMYFHWESSIPFVPVDATVNSCGVLVYGLKVGITYEDFVSRIDSAKKKIKKSEYNWNFERGNHFISVCQMDNGRNCVVMHASADEYKKTILNSSLYPMPEVWYYDSIHLIESEDGNRYLRYLIGDVAERFISIALQLEEINHVRMKSVAELIFGNLLDEEIMYVPHYGMPTRQSIAIGCSWKENGSVLLTAPGRDFYIIKPLQVNSNNLWLTPHGFGSTVNLPQINYKNKKMFINNKEIKTDIDVNSLSGKDIRFANVDGEEYQLFIQDVLKKCTAYIQTTIHPLYSVNKNGITNFVI